MVASVDSTADFREPAPDVLQLLWPTKANLHARKYRGLMLHLMILGDVWLMNFDKFTLHLLGVTEKIKWTKPSPDLAVGIFFFFKIFFTVVIVT